MQTTNVTINATYTQASTSDTGVCDFENPHPGFDFEYCWMPTTSAPAETVVGHSLSKDDGPRGRGSETGYLFVRHKRTGETFALVRTE